jgi:hypothetical protein
VSRQRVRGRFLGLDRPDADDRLDDVQRQMDRLCARRHISSGEGPHPAPRVDDEWIDSDTGYRHRFDGEIWVRVFDDAPHCFVCGADRCEHLRSLEPP